MKKAIYLLSLVTLLFAGCNQSTGEAMLNVVASETLLLLNQKQIVEVLGTPKKKQNRTGNFSAYYFEDFQGTHIVVTFSERNEAVDIVVCSQSNPQELLSRIIKDKTWKNQNGSKVYTNSESGHSVYIEDTCTYLTTNWTNRN